MININIEQHIYVHYNEIYRRYSITCPWKKVPLEIEETSKPYSDFYHLGPSTQIVFYTGAVYLF